MIELRTHEGIPEDRASRADWDQLLAEDPAATLFHGPRYLATWHRLLGQRVEALIHTIHADGQLIGIIPEAHTREGSPTGPIEVRGFLGGSDVTDYLGPISRPADRADVARAYLGDLAADRDWDDVVLGGLAADSGWADAFSKAAGEHGLTLFERDTEDVCPVVSLEQGYDHYLLGLKSKSRHELTRKTRKLARDGGSLEVVEVPADRVGEDLELFLDLAKASAPRKAGFFAKEELRDWFRGLAAEFAHDGIFRLHVLSVGGMPGAMTVSLVYRGRWGVYNSAYDPALGALGPGIVLINELIEIAAKDGCTDFDLLRGEEPYKYQFGAVDRHVERVTLVRR